MAAAALLVCWRSRWPVARSVYPEPPQLPTSLSISSAQLIPPHNFAYSHGPEFNSFRRRTKSKRPREFQLRPQEKFLYTCGAIDLWEWELRLLDLEEGAAGDQVPICLAGRVRLLRSIAAAPHSKQIGLVRGATPRGASNFSKARSERERPPRSAGCHRVVPALSRYSERRNRTRLRREPRRNCQSDPATGCGSKR